MAETDTTDFEIGSVENFHSNKDEQFSHSSLVMSSMRKCLENGSKEMRQGWTDNKQDKHGNTLTIYHEDSRLAFIESIRTLMMIMFCDLDKEAKDVIDRCNGEIADERKRIVELNDKMWKEMDYQTKQGIILNGNGHISGKITHHVLVSEFTEFELLKYREIFSELSNLSKRLEFWKTEMFEA